MKQKIYFDYAATTPIDSRVVKAMEPFFNKKFGNASSLHSFGNETKKVLEKNRNIIAKAINAKESEIIFTSSATESNNTALKGVAFANKGKHILVSSVEHDCVLNSAKWLKAKGYDVELLSVDKYGMVNPKEVERKIRKDTILVSVMHVNNEVGTIEPISEIGSICRKNNVYFHTDASQSFGKIPINVVDMNIDLLTASSQKIYGPKGAAILFIRNGVKIEPLLHGGGQEMNMRSSTENIPAIVGFGKATELCLAEMKKENKRLTKLRDRIIKTILKKIDNSYLNGHPKERISNNVNIRFSFIEGESILFMLDSFGVGISTASACSSPKLEPSHVLSAMGLKHEEAHGSIRISIGRMTKDKDVDYLLNVLPKAIEKIRLISPHKK
ncbi:MAG: cysteine desulfurase family protein [Candidatus Pacebacteria bacterium]|nr:cysteine desulfurase family protein [Candidatus Paceibacterota bacterium]